MAVNIINSGILSEGYEGRKREFVYDPWPDIYASRQHARTYLNVEVIGMETHTIPINGENQEVPCLVVSFHEDSLIRGLIPKDYSGVETESQMRKLIGQRVNARVVAIDKENELVVLNRRAVLEEIARQTWEELKEGDVRTVTVRGLNWRYAIVDLGGIEVKLPAEELSWGYIDDVRDELQLGDTFDVKVKSVDKEKQEVTISLKDLLPCPWPEAAKRFKEGNDYVATVSGVVEYGIFVNLPMKGVSALCPQPPRREVRESLKRGDKVLVTIRNVDAENKKIFASLKYPLDRTIRWA